MKKYFLTFGDRRLKPSVDRLKIQAESIESYDEIIVKDETDLDPKFREKFASKLVYGTKGYGNMCWKPEIILRTLEMINDGDLLTWSDADSHVNPKGKKRLQEYFDMVMSSETGVTGVQSILPTDPELAKIAIPLYNLERKFTKGDLLDYFNVRHNTAITDSEQLASGTCFFRKCNKSVDLVKQWAIVPHIDFGLIDDSPSKSPNLEGFIGHRHDQSIFSIICKLNNVENISFYETMTPIRFNPVSRKVAVSFDNLERFPIWHMGDKQWAKINDPTVPSDYVKKNK